MKKTQINVVETSIDPDAIEFARVWLSGTAMQGLIQATGTSHSETYIAEKAVRYADALLDELGY